MELAGALPGTGEEYVRGQQSPFCFVCTDDPPLLTAGTLHWAAYGWGNLDMKTWLLTWSLRKMSNFSEYVSSVGKYHKENLNWTQLFLILKVLLILPLLHSKLFVRICSLRWAFLYYINVSSQQILTVPSRCSFRNKVYILPAAKFDNCTQLGPSLWAMLLAERTFQIQCLVGAVVQQVAPNFASTAEPLKIFLLQSAPVGLYWQCTTV